MASATDAGGRIISTRSPGRPAWTALLAPAFPSRGCCRVAPTESPPGSPTAVDGPAALRSRSLSSDVRVTGKKRPLPRTIPASLARHWQAT
jgi:hypothetical protein